MPEKELSTEEQIKAAAKKIFVKKGFAGARMQEIADEAGINKALLHYYYRNKAKLFEVIFEETFHMLLPKMTQVVTADKSIIEKIEMFIPMYIQTIRMNPHIPLFILNELNQDSDRLVNRIKSNVQPEIFMGLMQQVQMEIAQGKIRPINPIHLIMNIVSMSAFPFIAKPLLKQVMGMDDTFFDQLMKERTKVVLDFTKAALVP